MNYPENQQPLPIPGHLQIFMGSDRGLNVDVEGDRYSIFIDKTNRSDENPLDRSILEVYSAEQLEQLQVGLVPTDQRLARKMQHSFGIYNALRDNIRCWYGAISIDTTFGPSQRYFINSVEQLSTNDSHADLASMRVMAFSTVLGPNAEYKELVT